VTVFFIFILISSGRGLPKHRNLRRLLKSDPNFLREKGGPSESRELRNRDFGFATNTETALTDSFLDLYENRQDDDSKHALVGAMEKLIRDRGGAEAAFYISLVTIMIGGGYVIVQLISR